MTFSQRKALKRVYRFSFSLRWPPLSSALSNQFAWKESGPIIADTRTSASTQLWNPLKSELVRGNDLKLFGPCCTSRAPSPPAIREEKSSQAWRSSAQWENKGDDGGDGGEHGRNEWVGQTTITTAHSPAEDHDTSPANRSALASPSSLFNISCGAMGVHNTHTQAHISTCSFTIRAHHASSQLWANSHTAQIYQYRLMVKHTRNSVHRL